MHVHGLGTDPADPDVWVAATDTQMLRTTDAGRTRKLTADSGGLLGWATHRALYAVDLDGHLSVSADGGRTWTERGRLRGAPAAFEAERGALLAALHDGAIMRSTDGGRSWRPRSTPKAALTAGG